MVVTLRLCLSGSDACSALVPCEACRTALAQYLMPSALLAAGINTPEGVEAFFAGYNQARAALLAELKRSIEEQKRVDAPIVDPLGSPTVPSEPKEAQVQMVEQAPQAPARKKRPVRVKASGTGAVANGAERPAEQVSAGSTHEKEGNA